MATVRANNQGEIIQFLASELEEQENPTPPAGTAYTLRFDEQTNQGLVSAYQANSAQFAMNGGTLTQNGTPVTINTPSDLFLDKEDLISVKSKLRRNSLDPLTTSELKLLFRLGTGQYPY